MACGGPRRSARTGRLSASARMSRKASTHAAIRAIIVPSRLPCFLVRTARADPLGPVGSPTGPFSFPDTSMPGEDRDANTLACHPDHLPCRAAMRDAARPVAMTVVRKRPRLRIVEAAGAGFPSPAQDWEETGIDLVEMLSLERAASYVFRVSGESMIDAGLNDGDTLIVDRDGKPRRGSIVIAVCDGGFVVRQIDHVDGIPHLVGRNARRPYRPRRCDEDVEIWGVVRTVVRNLI